MYNSNEGVISRITKSTNDEQLKNCSKLYNVSFTKVIKSSREMDEQQLIQLLNDESVESITITKNGTKSI